MLGNLRFKKKSYYLVAVRKDDVIYCGSYIKDKHDEFIISINTGEKFYSLHKFAATMLNRKFVNEYRECIYYSEYQNKWRSIKHILKKRRV